MALRTRSRPPPSRVNSSPSPIPTNAAPSENSPETTDSQFVQGLSINVNGVYAKRIGRACRRIIKITGKPVQEWAADFLPKKWSINLVEDMATLVGHCEGDREMIRQVEGYLLQAVTEKKEKGKKNLYLKAGDINKAIQHFRPEPGDSQAASKRMRRTIHNTDDEEYGEGGDDEDGDTDGDEEAEDGEVEHSKGVDGHPERSGSTNKTQDEHDLRSSTKKSPKKRTAPSATTRPDKHARTDIQAIAHSPGVDGSDRAGVALPDTSECVASRVEHLPSTKHQLPGVMNVILAREEEVRKHISSLNTKQENLLEILQADETPLREESSRLTFLQQTCDRRREELDETKQQLQLVLGRQETFRCTKDSLGLEDYLVKTIQEQYARQILEANNKIPIAEAELQRAEEMLRTHFESIRHLKDKVETTKAEMAQLEEEHQRMSKDSLHWRTIGGLLELGPNGTAALETFLKGHGTSLDVFLGSPGAES